MANGDAGSHTVATLTALQRVIGLAPDGIVP
jgi:hypothetical protein